MKDGLIIKEQPGVWCESLRYLVGRMERRPMRVPVHPRLQSSVLRVSEEQVEVFWVLGYGSTLAKAQRRAELQGLQEPGAVGAGKAANAREVLGL